MLANVGDGVVDEHGHRTATPYPLRTEDPKAHVRFRSVLREDGGNDFYGLFRIDVMRRMRPQGTYLHMDRVLVAEASLMGRFCEIPEGVFFRTTSRASPRASVACPERTGRPAHVGSRPG